MYLDTISILNYKNIASADMAFSPRLNCFIGDNGAGKTNILDAVYFLCCCKSRTQTAIAHRPASCRNGISR